MRLARSLLLASRRGREYGGREGHGVCVWVLKTHSSRVSQEAMHKLESWLGLVPSSGAKSFFVLPAEVFWDEALLLEMIQFPAWGAFGLLLLMVN